MFFFPALCIVAKNWQQDSSSTIDEWPNILEFICIMAYSVATEKMDTDWFRRLFHGTIEWEKPNAGRCVTQEWIKYCKSKSISYT